MAKKAPGKSFAQILSEEQSQTKARSDAKIPLWSGLGLRYPTSLCLEQCSSQAAALYKASLLPQGCRVADLTGGLGVDSWAFSRRAKAVFYNERNPDLARVVERNFALLGVSNVTFNCFDVAPSRPDWLSALRDFGADRIYLDPARRSSVGGKVFRPQDCQPDVIALLPQLRALTPYIMVKLSPMADISVLSAAFGCFLREVHVVSLGNEVKELLCIVGPEECAEPQIRVVDCESSRCTLAFTRSEEACARSILASDAQLVPGAWLCEPGAALLKAGAFKLCCEKFGLGKMDVSTHLYVSPQALAGTLPFKCFRILEVLPLDKLSMRSVASRYPHADLTARNIPLSTDSLRRALGLTPGPSGGIHLFAFGTPAGRRIAVCASQ